MHALTLRIFILSSTLLSIAAASYGGSGGIASDGKAYLAASSNLIIILDLKAKTYREIPPSEVDLPLNFAPCAISRAGSLIGTTGKEAIMADLEKGTTVVIYQAPVGAIISDLAYNPKDGAVAAMLYPETSEGSLEDTLIYIPKDPAEARSVYCRRARNLHGMTFSNDGQFYFGSDGDLWAGTIEHDVSNFVLVAERHAPLAARETYVGTSASIGVTDVAAINDHLLVGLHRMGGTGMGALVLLEGQNELKEPETTDTPDVVRFANRTTKYMANMKHLQDTYGVHKLATSADQNIGLVTYSFENGQLNAFVLDSDGRVSNVAFQKANKD